MVNAVWPHLLLAARSAARAAAAMPAMQVACLLPLPLAALVVMSPCCPLAAAGVITEILHDPGRGAPLARVRAFACCCWVACCLDGQCRAAVRWSLVPARKGAGSMACGAAQLWEQPRPAGSAQTA